MGMDFLDIKFQIEEEFHVVLSIKVAVTFPSSNYLAQRMSKTSCVGQAPSDIHVEPT